MRADAQTADPIVETSVIRFIRTRLQVTHEDQGVCVISGPWGIGKTTAVESFAGANRGSCIVVKVERGSTTRGASSIFVLQQTLEALRRVTGRSPGVSLSNAYWSLRQMLYTYVRDWRSALLEEDGSHISSPLSILFDEAQYLSAEAIEMLRFWNDDDRTVTPERIGLMFLGNSEFALNADHDRESVLSGAVKSRALFIETLNYNDVSDEDIKRFICSRTDYDDDALALLLHHFRKPRVRRDFRSISRIDNAARRKRPTGPIAVGDLRCVLA